ncbi:hypothetical protein K7432_006623 [Basidiobolus ranarum]|uniref:Uncharacterized protein n=1 Tax=Basidiobolus ranarum TaxID=34480 RepID=A0ABR2W1B2_9FUNG
MTAKQPDLNDLFNPASNTTENFRYSTDFTRELLAEFDTHRRKMHQELESQRMALESGVPLPDEQTVTESTPQKKQENPDEVPPKPVSPVQERKTGHKLKTLRKNILHMWRNHEATGKEEVNDVRRAKSWNPKESQEKARAKDRRSIFGTWKNFTLTTCIEDTTVDT